MTERNPRPSASSSMSSFSTTRYRVSKDSAALGSRLDSAIPGDPLASLDVPGQRLVIAWTPHLTRKSDALMLLPLSSPAPWFTARLEVSHARQTSPRRRCGTAAQSRWAAFVLQEKRRSQNSFRNRQTRRTRDSAHLHGSQTISVSTARLAPRTLGFGCAESSTFELRPSRPRERFYISTLPPPAPFLGLGMSTTRKIAMNAAAAMASETSA
jgi:hypothetical protein